MLIQVTCSPWLGLQKYHRGTIIRLPNFAQLENNPAAIESLIKKLLEAKPRYIAIAPRPENFRENVLLTLWSVFARLDQSGQISVFPGWLNAPDDASFSRLIDRSINQQTLTNKSMHPMIFAQVPGPRAGGTRSVAKAALLQKYFEQLGFAAPGFILKTSSAIQAGIQTPMFDAQRAVLNLDAGFLTEIPNVQKQQLSNANLVLLFGHGITGMTCSIDVGAFKTVSFDNKIVLCGSCFSASPDHSDFNSEPENVDDIPNANETRHAKESFAKRVVANGAKLFYGQMNTNGGFPELYVILSNLLQGETAGESYQRLLNNRIQASGLSPEQFALQDKTTSNAQEKGQRSELLYVLIGDPALIPIDLQRG